MTDPQGDQQTGQGADDFVGDATRYFAQSQAGTTTFGTGDYLFIRTRMDTYDADDKWGNGGNLGIGMDLDGNGTVDMIMMFSESAGNVKNRTRTITFGTPGAGANTGPSTTTWTFPTQTAINLTVDQTYDVQSATAVDGYAFSGTTDAWLTFGLSFAQLQTAIRTYAVGSFSNYVVDYNSRIAFIAFTSTQNNALNQDLGGTAGNTSSTQTWAQLGAITPPMNPGGFIPEPATYAQIGALLVVGAVGLYRRRLGKSR